VLPLPVRLIAALAALRPKQERSRTLERGARLVVLSGSGSRVPSTVHRARRQDGEDQCDQPEYPCEGGAAIPDEKLADLVALAHCAVGATEDEPDLDQHKNGRDPYRDPDTDDGGPAHEASMSTARGTRDCAYRFSSGAVVEGQRLARQLRARRLRE
jgi:hypothetical protein